MFLAIFVFCFFFWKAFSIICGNKCGGGTKGYYGGKCYCYMDNTDSWDNHETWCGNNFYSDHTGVGNLTSIHSLEEKEFVISLATNRFYVGLRDTSTVNIEGPCDWNTLYWSDGTPIDYKFPVMCDENPVPNGKCMTYNVAEDAWWDITCNAGHRAICGYRLYCFGMWAGDPYVCSGKGSCESDDICTCEQDYFGPDCGIYKCYGKFSNETSSVCNGHGNCTSTDTCDCEVGYGGLSCDTRLDGLCEDPSDRFGGKCYENFGNGRVRSDAESYCDGWAGFVPSHLVSLHSLSEEDWVRTNKMPGPAFLGLTKYPEGSLFPCPTEFGFDWEDGTNTSYADSHAVNCDSDDLCIGDVLGDWNDVSCSNSSLDTVCKFEIPKCYGYYSYEVEDVCSGHGQCVSTDNCSCTFSRFGKECDNWNCFGIPMYDDIFVCSGHGQCISRDYCSCEKDYIGDNCNTTICFGIRQDDLSNVCNGRGVCKWPDQCSCDQGYAGKKCEFVGGCNGTFQSKTDILMNRLDGADDGWACYFDYDFGRTDQIGAEEWCNLEWDGTLPNGHLSSIENEYEWDFLWSLVQDPPGEPVWIGLMKTYGHVDCSQNDWMKWTDNTTTDWLIQTSGKTFSACDDVLHVAFTMDSDFPDVLIGDWEWDRWFNFICKRPIYQCFGHHSFHHESVCSGRGICVLPDECICSSPLEYLGIECNITYCMDVISNSSDVCSGYGRCWPMDKCSCDRNYYSIWCDVSTCDGIFSNDTSKTCSGHGTCWPMDTCSCDEGYFGSVCNITTCEGIFSNDTEIVCNGHGECRVTDSCTCYNPLTQYFGDNCDKTYCYGVPENSKYPRTCSGRGSCVGLDHCSCFDGYFGVNCNVTTCQGHYSNSSLACFGGKGKCWPKDRCSCIGPPYIGEFCEFAHPCTSQNEHSSADGFCYKNFGVVGSWNESEDHCKGWYEGAHLISITSPSEDSFVDTYIATPSTSDTIYLGALKKTSSSKKYPCPPSAGYSWTDGSSDSYAVLTKSSSVVCTTNYSCIGMMNNGQWNDVDCQSSSIDTGCKYKIPVCFGVVANIEPASLVCTGHGYCFQEDNCSCIDSSFQFSNDEYFGQNCNETYCDGVPTTNTSHVCHGHGVCWPFGSCACLPSFDGTYCSHCNENEGYYGKHCNEYFNSSMEVTLEVNSSRVFLPYQIPLDIEVLFSRREDIVEEDMEEFPCEQRVKNWEEYKGDSDEDWPRASCYWKLDPTNPSVTLGIIYQINHDSVIYDPVPDGQLRYHDFHIHLCTESRNITLQLFREGNVVPPTKPPTDDDGGDGDIGGVVAGAVAGGLAMGLIVLIIFSGLCAGLLMSCLCCLLLIVLVFITFLFSCGVFLLMCCSGTTVATTGAGAAVVGKEVHDEVMDEGPDFVTDAVKERLARKERGETIGGEIELDNVDVGEEFITDNLQDDILRKDDEFDDPEGLDVLVGGNDDEKNNENNSNNNENDGFAFGIDLEEGEESDGLTEEEREVAKRREEEYQRKLEERKEEERKERLELSKLRDQKEKILMDKSMKSVKNKMEEIRKKEMEEAGTSLSLGDTKFARKKKKEMKKKMKKMEKGLVKEHEKEVRKIEKLESKSLSLRSFEKRKKKEKKLEKIGSIL